MATRKADLPLDRKKIYEEDRAAAWRELELLQRLVRLARGRVAALDELLGATPMPRNQKPIDYIKNYLEGVGHFVERNALIEAVHLQGGADDVESWRQSLGTSITINAVGHKTKGRKPKGIVRIVPRGDSEFVGLAIWGPPTAEMFK